MREAGDFRAIDRWDLRQIPRCPGPAAAGPAAGGGAAGPAGGAAARRVRARGRVPRSIQMRVLGFKSEKKKLKTVIFVVVLLLKTACNS